MLLCANEEKTMSFLIYDNSSSIRHHAVYTEVREGVASSTLHRLNCRAYLDNYFSNMRCLLRHMEVEGSNSSNSLCHFYRSLFFSQLCASTYPCPPHLFPYLIKAFGLLCSFICIVIIIKANYSHDLNIFVMNFKLSR